MSEHTEIWTDMQPRPCRLLCVKVGILKCLYRESEQHWAFSERGGHVQEVDEEDKHPKGRPHS